MGECATFREQNWENTASKGGRVGGGEAHFLCSSTLWIPNNVHNVTLHLFHYYYYYYYYYCCCCYVCSVLYILSSSCQLALFSYPDSCYHLCVGCLQLHNLKQTMFLGQRFSKCGPRTTSGPRVCPCGPFRLNISPKKTEKIKLTWIAYHTL